MKRTFWLLLLPALLFAAEGDTVIQPMYIVATKAMRPSLSSGLEGTLCYVKNIDSLYLMKNISWTLIPSFSFSGGGGGMSVHGNEYHSSAFSTIHTTLSGYGITDGCTSTDGRLSDARTPLTHSHSAGDVTGTAVTTNDSRLSDARNAADVYAWAKETTKPTYTYTDVGADASGAASTVQSNLTTHGNLTTTAHGGVCASNDSRLSDARTPTAHDNTYHSATYITQSSAEPPLGNPSVTGYVLSSTTSGTRSWVVQGGGGGGIDMTTIVNAIRAKPFLYTDFLGTAGAATIEASQGWDYAVLASGTQAKIAGEQNHPGILRTSSSTTTNSGGYCTIEATAYLLAGGETFELIFQHRVASGTNTTLRFGFLDNITSADAVDGCYFGCPAASLNLVGKTSSNSVRSTSPTVYTLVVNTWYRAKVQLNSNATSVTFTLYNDAGSSLGSQSLATNIPTASGRGTGAGFVATNVGTTAVLLAYWDFMAVWTNDRVLAR